MIIPRQHERRSLFENNTYRRTVPTTGPNLSFVVREAGATPCNTRIGVQTGIRKCKCFKQLQQIILKKNWRNADIERKLCEVAG